MSTFDVRNSNPAEITEIVFADSTNKVGDYQAYSIIPNFFVNVAYASISDSVDCVNIYSKEHAENLIKALRKAIELGWVE